MMRASLRLAVAAAWGVLILGALAPVLQGGVQRAAVADQPTTEISEP